MLLNNIFSTKNIPTSNSLHLTISFAYQICMVCDISGKVISLDGKYIQNGKLKMLMWNNVYVNLFYKVGRNVLSVVDYEKCTENIYFFMVYVRIIDTGLTLFRVRIPTLPGEKLDFSQPHRQPGKRLEFCFPDLEKLYICTDDHFGYHFPPYWFEHHFINAVLILQSFTLAVHSLFLLMHRHMVIRWKLITNNHENLDLEKYWNFVGEKEWEPY